VVERRLSAPLLTAPDPSVAAPAVAPDSIGGRDAAATGKGGADVSSAIDSNGGRDARPTHDLSMEIPGAIEGPSVINPCTLLIAVYVDELPHHVTQGFLSMIAPHHGGIWQDVRMYSTGPLAIRPDGVHIETDQSTGRVEVTAAIDGQWQVSDRMPDLLVSRPSPNGERVAVYYSGDDPDLDYTYDAGLSEFTLISYMNEAEVQVWQFETPAVYSARVAFLEAGEGGESTFSDVVFQCFAFRTIETDGSQLLLNGEPIYIRSALNWGYYPGAISPDPGPEVIRREFAYLKSLGFNAETVCLINMPDYFYDIADEMGMLIWQEYPTWHNTFTPEHLPTYRREFESYLRRDRNHPSVIMRSISVEAGVEDQQVMGELVGMAREMTDTPVQDNNSWFWLSNAELTDWYGEDNYLNCNQWARHMLKTLPARLDEMPEKPYIIGETMCFNCWPDIDGLSRFLTAVDDPALAAAQPGLFGSGEYWRGLGIEPNETLGRQFGGPSPYPYWYPICFDRCCEIEWQLSERYNSGLPDGEDIIRDYLKRQSADYATASRRFQMQLMHADPRYRGYTINVVRDIPQLRGGLLDDLGMPRYDPADWSWHGDHTTCPVSVGQAVGATHASPATSGMAAEITEPPALRDEMSEAERWREHTAPLMAWRDEWGSIDRSTPVYIVDGGYQDVRALTAGWEDTLVIAANEVAELEKHVPSASRNVIISSVLTHDMVRYMAQGGVVILLTSKWPGGLGSHHHFFWRDSFFAPPVGPFDRAGTDKLVRLHPFDLTFEKAEVIPVDTLGITADVDPLIRLYDTHDLDTVITYDALFATRVGEGMLIASSLDHTTEGGQWVLGELCRWADAWVGADVGAKPRFARRGRSKTGPDSPNNDSAQPSLGRVLDSPLRRFPVASIAPDRLLELATARANTIIPLDEDWRFILDPDQQGEEIGYQRPDILIEFADMIDCGRSWESQGYSYDGMAWYRKWVTIPADWEGGSVKLIAEGIDDAYQVWVNGEPVALHGSFTVHEESVWLVQTVTDLTDYLRPGESNLIVLQVVDITGQGGVYKPLYLAVE